MSAHSRIPVVDVGTPSPAFQANDQGWETVDVRFHGFESLPSRKDQDWTYSPEFTCLGHPWKLQIFPGGDNWSGYVALYLCNESGESIKLKRYGFRAKDKYGEGKSDFSKDDPDQYGNGWGLQNFAKRSDLIESLVDGTLIIEVRMMKSVTTPECPFIPDNPTNKTIVKKFMEEESADMMFEVSSGGEVLSFPAHRFILENNAPELSAFWEPGSEDATIIPINDVKPEIFLHMLYYIYGGEIAHDDVKANALDLLDASDKYGVVNLKLKAEAVLVTTATIDVDNVMELLHYSNDKNCALLKEKVMDFIVENKNEVMTSVSLESFPGVLVKDLLNAFDMKGSMRINTLRKKLHERGLEVDGSRESLIARLDEHSSD